jgi:hypothetical protein
MLILQWNERDACVSAASGDLITPKDGGEVDASTVVVDSDSVLRSVQNTCRAASLENRVQLA